MLHSVGRALRAPSQRTWPQPCERPRSRPRPSALAAHAAARGARGARDLTVTCTRGGTQRAGRAPGANQPSDDWTSKLRACDTAA